jgi:succinoglycan biosynthesis transport protein ExoP
LNTSTTGSEDRGLQSSDRVKEIDLLDIGRAIWSKFWFVILLTLIGAALAFGITNFLIHPTYRSSFTVYVNNHSSNSENQVNSLNSGDTAASQTLAQTYASILKSRPVVEDAMDRISMNTAYDDIVDDITTEVDTDSQLVTLDVTMESAKEARNLARAIARVSPKYIANIVEGSSMKIVSSPILADKPYAPSIPKNTAIGAIIGFLLAVVIVVIRHLSDDRIKSVEELKAKFGFSVIGTIPNFDEAANNKGKSPWPIQEAYKALRTNVTFSLPGAGCKVIGVTSAFRHDGKSTNAVNTAISFSQIDKKVALIEGDLRLPTLSKKLGCRQVPGLSDMLIGDKSLKECTRTMSTHKNLAVIPAGNIPPDPTWLLQSEQMTTLVDGLKNHFDYIFIDLPPITSVADALILSPLIDGYLLVVRNNVTEYRAVADALEQMRIANAKVIGFIYNDAETSGGGKYYRYYK